MRLFLDFEPCEACAAMIRHLAGTGQPAKFLRHLTYNHAEAVRAVMEAPAYREEFDFFK